MDFGEQIKNIRTGRNLTQQQMADKLKISRQAVSNWENNRNLPDIEMLIEIARAFDLTLDALILGGDHMSNMTEKLIHDSSETNRIKMNLKCIKIGATLLALGVASILLGLLGPVLFEDFFVSIAYLFFLGGVVSFLVVGIKNLSRILKKS